MTLLSFLRTQIAQIKGIISLTLVIMSFEHGMHERNGISRLRSWLTSPKSQISLVYIFRTRKTRKNGISRLRSGLTSPKSWTSVVYIFWTRKTRKNGISRLRSGLTSPKSQISLVYIFRTRKTRKNGISRLRSWLISLNTKDTKGTEYLACARDYAFWTRNARKERNRLAYARDLRSSEGAIPKRAVRKGCYMDCYSILRSVGPTSIVTRVRSLVLACWA